MLLDAVLPIVAALALAPVKPANLDSDRVRSIIDNSDLSRRRWRGRGRAPRSYLHGMALVFAEVAKEYMEGVPAAVEMARPPNGRQDVLIWLDYQFTEQGMHNQDATGLDTLRHLFVLLIGLGMRESSGSYCEGAYDNFRADTAEAGLFQTSWDAHVSSPEIRRLFEHYGSAEGIDGLLGVFSQGIRCRNSQFRNHGSGDGRAFQQLSKMSPAFAVKVTAVGLRNLRRHWGPVNRREVEISWDANFMLYLVQQELGLKHEGRF